MRRVSLPRLLVLGAVFLAAAAVGQGVSAPPASRPTTPTASARGPVTFAADIMPLIDRLGCAAAACHGSSGGKGGLRLSLFGGAADQDYAALTRAAPGRRINPVEPAQSLLILKTTGALPHPGAKPMAPNSPERRLLLAWVNQGAAFRDDKAPALTAVEVAPRKQTLAKGQSQQFTVTALYADGARKDVSRDARYRALDPAVAVVAPDGTVTAKDWGETALVASYLRHSAVARIVVPQVVEMPVSTAALPVAPPGPPMANRVDELVLAKLEELNVPPSGLCSDAELVRRVYLDTIGILPTPDEARGFLADRDPAKRARLIDRLLTRSEFADFQALKWGDLLRIKSEYPINLWPNAVQAYAHWVRDAIATNKPYDRFARELLTATGSDFRSPPANYYRALPKRDARGFAETTALTFMGARLQCARCHVHPTENWTPDDTLGMAAFFANIQFKPTGEWKEEIVLLNPDGVLRSPATGLPVAPKFLGGDAPVLQKGEDPRAKFADWLTAPDNPWFARNIVNRVWFWLLGRGIVHEPDDLRPTNPPTNPELLDFLAGELVSRKYDLRHIYRLILNSRMYQASSKANQWNAKDVAHFSHYRLKRLTAEQLLDAIGQVTGTSEPFSSPIPEPFTFMPEGFRATQLPDGSIGAPFLELFGRPPRDTPFEAERDSDVSLRQALHLLNSVHIETKVARGARLQGLLKAGKSDAEIIDEVYLAALSRRPTEDEQRTIKDYIARKPQARVQAIQDVVCVILNTKEFLFNH